MPSCRSVSSQNTRVFAPHVILQQDTTRLSVTLSSGQGYTLAAGLTAGDVIRYDPINNQYLKAQADVETNAEVLGVIESGKTAPYTVVISGSIKYPTERLSPILDGGDGGKDILFLNDAVAGGLTGTIETGDGIKIVKPVMQLAPHGQYNGVVVNYIGYKTGSAPTTEGLPTPPSGALVFGPEGIGNDVYIPLKEDQYLNPSDSSQAFSFFGTEAGPWLEEITITSGLALTQSLVTNKAQAYQLKNGLKVNAGTIEDVDTINNRLYIRKGAGVGAMDSTLGGVYINGYQYGFSNSEVNEFFVPKVEAPNLTQGGSPLIAYLKTKDTTSVLLPDDISCINLTASDVLTVDSVDVGAKLAELEAKINLLNARIKAF